MLGLTGCWEIVKDLGDPDHGFPGSGDEGEGSTSASGTSGPTSSTADALSASESTFVLTTSGADGSSSGASMDASSGLAVTGSEGADATGGETAGGETAGGGTAGGETAGGETAGGGTAETEGPACNAIQSANPSSNYGLEIDMTLSYTTVRPNTELFFDWSGLTSDLYGRPLDPETDIGVIWVGLWHLTPEEFQQQLETGDFEQGDIVAIVSREPDDAQTSASLFEFTALGNPLTQAELLAYFDPERIFPDEHTYVLMAATGETIGSDTRMLASFQLDETAENTTVRLDAQSSTATPIARFGTPLYLPTGARDFELDWENLTVDALGTERPPTVVDRVEIARYDLSIAELEASFQDLRSLADERWTANVTTGTQIYLSRLTNAEGEAFAGLDDGGTWLVSLECGNCFFPYPVYMAELQPCPG